MLGDLQPALSARSPPRLKSRGVALSGEPLAGEPGLMGSFHLDVMFAGLSRWPALSCSQERGLLGQTEPSLMHGGRTMESIAKLFVAFDVAKKKHAVAIAEGGRRGKVDFLSRSKTARCRSNARSGDWRIGTTGCRSA